ncbi:MAG: AMP-binding protein [Chloroflexota bacterium]
MQLPMFHTGGFNVFTAPLVHIGGTSVVCKGFDPDQTFDLIRDNGVNLFVGVPTMHLMLMQHPRWKEADLSNLKICGSGGASCPQPVVDAFAERDILLFTGYGLTEAGPNTFWLPPEQRLANPQSVGYPLMHIDVSIVREDGSACGPDEIGELLVRGPHVCRGYWNKPEETANAITPEGWLHTGDLARRDSDGRYYIVGRIKDMIISGGENVYPAEVESVMHAHPAVAEAALVGIPDEKWGEVGWAFIVVKPGRVLTEDELIAFCRERLAKFKLPKAVIFLDALPKTGANKIDKKLLAEQHQPA